MSFLNKNYSFVKQENFDGFLRAIGMPEEKIEKVLKYRPDQKLTKDGDTYTYHTYGVDGAKDIKFQSGVEFDDVIGADNIPIKTKYVVDGNTVTQTVTSSLGSGIFKREYTGDDLIVTITSDKFNGICKRFYKAA